MKRILLATLASTVFFAVPAYAQNLILNESFESPTIAANSTLQTTPDSWLGDSQPVIVNGEISPGYSLPQDGQQFVSLGHFPGLPQAASLSQAFTVISSGSYVLNWFDSSEFNGPANSAPYTVIVTDSVAGNVVSENYDSNATTLRVWTQRSISLALTPDTYTLHFISNQAPSGEGTLIDNVSVSLDIPEPSTLLLLGLAMAGALVLRQR